MLIPLKQRPRFWIQNLSISYYTISTKIHDKCENISEEPGNTTLNHEAQPTEEEMRNIQLLSERHIWKTGKKKVRGVPQSQTAAHPRHEEEEEADKTAQAQIEQTQEKHQD